MLDMSLSLPQALRAVICQKQYRLESTQSRQVPGHRSDPALMHV
jgi:hypothetical protein